jgi:hypothetical protein
LSTTCRVVPARGNTICGTALPHTLHRHYLYFCTSKASNASTWACAAASALYICSAIGIVSVCASVLVLFVATSSCENSSCAPPPPRGENSSCAPPPPRGAPRPSAPPPGPPSSASVSACEDVGWWREGGNCCSNSWFSANKSRRSWRLWRLK